ncbi:MAG TPA: threonine--tRNA ligase [Candidatus Caccovivens faecavium]|nr:threonine--tRNA ligase [Candidatus Caccovivens faecavium]
MEKDKKQEEIQKARHSLAHILAKALTSLYPNTKLTIGPSIDDGFYYDIDLDINLTPDHFPEIEKKMKEIINKGEDFTRKVVSKEEALKLFKGNEYKTEIINELPENEEVSLYYTGDDFFDLCRGPHVESAKKLQNYAYKIHAVNGAYWRGSEKNKMLQRVYVYAYPDKKQLAEHINMIEEAKKRDHRKLGKELKLFMISPEGPGFPFYLPKGMIIRNELIDYWRQIHTKAGYKEIMTPIMLNRHLWETSGHWDHYKDNMYLSTIDDETYAIKPMNCPGGVLVYKSEPHSYKELPLRLGELGIVHRYEKSGELGGLLRVRSFTQDDAHIFMTPSQIKDEIKNVVALIDEVYKIFNFTYHVELSTRPENSMGSDEDWELATNALKNALDELKLDYIINEGDGAFYGPKIDFHLKDTIGRTWQCGTIQLDFQLPQRFELEYVGEDGEKHRPIMIHRVIYGSIDRFIGLLIENFAGAFPLWLSPEQVRVLSLTERNCDYVNEITATLRENGLRAESDNRNEKIGYKIREALNEKVPYLIIVGDEEEKNKTISIRGRGYENKSGLNLNDFIARLKEEIRTKKI